MEKRKAAGMIAEILQKTTKSSSLSLVDTA
jgi:hypothetical protein